MKKYLLLLLLAVFTISCSKKVEVTGKIKGGSPLERIEFIEAAGVGTLPLANLSLDKDGNYKGSFETPKDGMYVITYAGKQGMIFLRKGEKLVLSGDAQFFPDIFQTSGNAKKDNDFIKGTQDFLAEYAPKVDFSKVILKDEAGFLAEVKKIETDLNKNIDETAKKTDAGSAVVSWKKDDMNISLYGLMSQYELSHGQMVNNPSFKVSPKFIEYRDGLVKNGDKLVADMPMYRNLLINTLSADFEKFAAKTPNSKDSQSTTFAKFLATKSDLSQTVKDYLLAYVISQTDLTPGATVEEQKKTTKLIDDNIKNNEVKKNLKDLQFVMAGPAQNEVAPEGKLETVDGKSFKLADVKGKPTVVMFYASWNPYIAEGTIPVVKEVVNFYKSKMNFVFVNMDDTKDQAIKTSANLLKGIDGKKVYAENGLQSEIAKKYGIYGFKLPSVILLDKDGKVASRFFYNLGEMEFVEKMDKLSGLKAPTVNPEITLQNDLLQQAQPAETAPAK